MAHIVTPFCKRLLGKKVFWRSCLINLEEILKEKEILLISNGNDLLLQLSIICNFYCYDDKRVKGGQKWRLFWC